VAVAIRTGVPAAAWLDDTNALITAVEIIQETDQKR
jgi:hypothetical protein